MVGNKYVRYQILVSLVFSVSIGIRLGISRSITYYFQLLVFYFLHVKLDYGGLFFAKKQIHIFLMTNSNSSPTNVGGQTQSLPLYDEQLARYVRYQFRHLYYVVLLLLPINKLINRNYENSKKIEIRKHIKYLMRYQQQQTTSNN